MPVAGPHTKFNPPEDRPTAGAQVLTIKRVILAVFVVNIWIVTLCTGPYLAGLYLYKWFDYPGDLPLRTLFPVAMNSLAVLAYLLVAKRTELLVWRRPKEPAYILLLLPLIAINFTRGPLIPLTVAAVLVLVLTNFCIGFWEEFLFRGLIQKRLGLLGPRIAALSTALLFTFIHWHKGYWQCFIVFAIGLTFCLVRYRIGLWTLVIIHSLIDLISDLFLRQWSGYGLTAKWLIYSYLGLCAVLLLRMKTPVDESPRIRASSSG